MTKEKANYKKNAFCDFQGFGGFYILDTHQENVICRVQITTGKFGDEANTHIHFRRAVHYLAIAQIAKCQIVVFGEGSNMLVTKGYS